MSWLNYEVAWDPFRELNRLQREVNRLFDGYSPEVSASQYPPVNIWSNGEEAVVTAEIPGVDPKDVEITVVKNQLTIQGERKADPGNDDLVCHRAERGAGQFVRTVPLPFEVEDARAKAKFDKGVLSITLPRSEATKPRKVLIEAH